MKISEILTITNILSNVTFHKDTPMDFILDLVASKNILLDSFKNERETIELLQKSLDENPDKTVISKIEDLYSKEIKVKVKKIKGEDFLNLNIREKTVKEYLNLSQLEIFLKNILN